MSKFLTLEGVPNPRRLNPLLAGLLDAPPKPRETAATRAAFAARNEAQMWKSSDEAERQTPAFIKRLEAMAKHSDDGQNYGKGDLFTIYGKPKGSKEKDSDDDNQNHEDVGGLAFFSMGESLTNDDSLSGWGRRFRRAFTPPARIRRAFTRLIPKRVTRLIHKLPGVRAAGRLAKFGKKLTIRKGLRYYGAWMTLPLSAFGGGKYRNKAFGLKGNEIKDFDVAAKVARVAAVAVATVFTLGAAAPALMSSMSSMGSAGMLKFMATTAGKSFLKQKAMGLIMKDGKGGNIFKMVMGAGGKMITSKFNKSSIPPEDYAALPDNRPIPFDPTYTPPASGGGGGGASSGGGFAPEQDESAIEPEMPASVAGSTSMTPGTQDTPPGYKMGEYQTDPAARADNTAQNPLGSYARVNSILEDDNGAIDAFDKSSIEEMKAAGSKSLPASEELTPTDESLSLCFDEALAHARARQRGGFRRARPGRSNLIWGRLA